MTTAWKWAIPVLLVALITGVTTVPWARIDTLEYRARALELQRDQDVVELTAIRASIVELKVAVGRVETKLETKLTDVVRQLDRLADKREEPQGRRK